MSEKKEKKHPAIWFAECNTRFTHFGLGKINQVRHFFWMKHRNAISYFVGAMLVLVLVAMFLYISYISYLVSTFAQVFLVVFGGKEVTFDVKSRISMLKGYEYTKKYAQKQKAEDNRNQEAQTQESGLIIDRNSKDSILSMYSKEDRDLFDRTSTGHYILREMHDADGNLVPKAKPIENSMLDHETIEEGIEEFKVENLESEDKRLTQELEVKTADGDEELLTLMGMAKKEPLSWLLIAERFAVQVRRENEKIRSIRHEVEKGLERASDEMSKVELDRKSLELREKHVQFRYEKEYYQNEAKYKIEELKRQKLEQEVIKKRRENY